MILNIEKYELLDSLLSKNSESLHQTVYELNEELLDKSVSLLIESKYEELKEEMNYSKRFTILLERSSSKNLDYYAGYFHALATAFSMIIAGKQEKVTFEKEMNALSKKANVKNILLYLYDHPDAQHKIISENTHVGYSYLSQLMRELEDVGCVERYASGKRSFYSLSLKGQSFTKMLIEKINLADDKPKFNAGIGIKNRPFSYTSNYIYSILDEEKYSIPFFIEVEKHDTTQQTNRSIDRLGKIVSELNSMNRKWTQEVKKKQTPHLIQQTNCKKRKLLSYCMS